MDRQKFIYIPVLTVFLMVVLLPVTAAQQTLGEDEKALVEKYDKAKAEYLSSVTEYKNARQDFRSARDKYRDLRRPDNRKMALERAKTFMLRADIAMINHLRLFKVRVRITRAISDDEKAAILTEIDAYISWLKDKQDDIKSAETRKELAGTAREIRDKWIDIRVYTKKITGKILVAKTDAVISRAETIADRIETRIPELQAEGKDTAEIERWLEDFRSKIELAKQKNEAAKQKFEEIKGIDDANRLFRQGHAFIKEANRYLRGAYKDLKEIVKALKASDSRIDVSGTGRLTASGDGRAYVEGNGTVEVGALRGTMIVSNDTVVETDGTGNRTTLDDGRVKYQGFGSATVRGERMMTELSGNGIDLVAEGTGTAILAGKGTYTVCGERCLEGEVDGRTGDWRRAGVRIRIATAGVE